MAQIVISNLWIRYGGVAALGGISLTLRQGEIIALIGPNGSGKTSLLRAVSGLLLPQAGSIGPEAGKTIPRWNLASRVAYLPTEPGFPPRMKVRTFLKLKADLLRVNSQIRDRMLGEAEVLLGGAVDRRVEALSRGQRMQLALLVGLVGSPEWIAADEPWSGLDPLAREAVLTRLADAAGTGAGVLLSSHDLQGLSDLAHRFLFLVQGTFKCLTSRAELLERAAAADVSASDLLLMMYREVVRTEGHGS